MASFVPDFGKYTDYTTKYPFNSVIFPANAPLNGEDLNEMQEIQKERMRLALSAIASDGYIHNYDAVSDPCAYSIDDTGDERIINYEIRLNGTAIVNGVAYHVEGEHSASYAESEASDVGSVYLTMEEIDIMADQTDSIYPNGGLSSDPLDNYLANNIFIAEISRRKGVKFSMEFRQKPSSIVDSGLDNGILIAYEDGFDGGFGVFSFDPRKPQMTDMTLLNHDGGFSAGAQASAEQGGAIGCGALTSRGFAGGYNAVAARIKMNGELGVYTFTPIDAIQLGDGRNASEHTLQVYQYQLMDASGNIPKGRFGNLPIGDRVGEENPGESYSYLSFEEPLLLSGAIVIGDMREPIFNDENDDDPNTWSLVEGNISTGWYSIAGGTQCVADGTGAIALGIGSYANSYGVALGYKVCAKTRGVATPNIAIGYESEAAASGGCAIGHKAIASGNQSLALGCYATASGVCSLSIGTNFNAPNTASGSFSTCMGYGNTTLDFQMKVGKYAAAGTGGRLADTTGDAFIIGNGTASDALSNAFRVTYAGEVYGTGAYSSTGADYAEYFEWEDGNPDNEDRRGRFVTLDGEKIRFATSDDDFVLGIISANPCVKGDVYGDDWQGKYLTDVFGMKLTQTVHLEAEYEEVEVIDPETGEKTTERIMIHDECDAEQWILNPDYDPEQTYVSRESRKEWAPVGFMGKLVVVDDGTCEVNGFCKPGESGIATNSSETTKFRVIARIDDTHIKILAR